MKELMSPVTQSKLVRSIGMWDMVAITLNGVIGAGIFGLPSKVFGLTGGYSLAAFLVCAVLTSLIVLCYAEVGSRFTGTGGPYLYAREAFGPLVGFEVGWLLWLARVSAFAANCNLLIGYISYFWPGAAFPTQRALLICSLLTALVTINVIGVRNATRANHFFTAGKLIPILIFVIAGVWFVEPQRFSFSVLPDYNSFSMAVLLLVYAFTGFEMAVIPTGEINDPRRTVPRGLLIAMAIVVALYIVIQIVCIGTLPGLAGSQRPLADAAATFLGAAGGSMIAAGVVISIAGNLHLVILSASRVPFAMAEREELPHFLAVTHRRFHTPHWAILFTGLVAGVLTLTGTFIYGLTISTIARLLVYAVTCAALPVLRRKQGASPAFQITGGVPIAGAAILLTAWLLSNNTGHEARDSAIAAATGMAIFAAYRYSKTTRPQ